MIRGSYDHLPNGSPCNHQNGYIIRGTINYFQITVDLIAAALQAGVPGGNPKRVHHLRKRITLVLFCSTCRITTNLPENWVLPENTRIHL